MAINDEGGMEPQSMLVSKEIYKAARNDVNGKKYADVAIAHWQEGRLHKATEVLRGALEKWRDDENLWMLLGAIYGELMDYNKSLNCNLEAVRLAPKSAVCLHGLACVFANTGQHAKFLEHELKAHEADPTFAPAVDGLAMAYQKTFQMPDAMAQYRDLLMRQPDNEEAISHLCLASIYMPETTPENLYITHRYYGEVAEKNAGEPPIWEKETDAGKKLRVGFFGTDFKKHSVAYFMEPLIRDLDKSKYEVYIYYFGSKTDEVTERYKTYADKFVQTVPHAKYAAGIRADELDVAFDLGGHTGHHLRLFAARIAPVQIVYMGYPSTTGLTRMDYRFTDLWADPIGEADKWHTEKLVRLEGTSWTYLPYPEVPPVVEAPFKKNGYVTFGSFNNFQKMSDGQLVTWRHLLDAVPGSKIIFKSFALGDDAVNSRVIRRLDAAGYGDRATLLEAVETTPQHLACYGMIDIALDPAPFNGATTTCEALMMGVPVVTLEGDRHAARVGVAILSAIGRKEWIAKGDKEFINVAAGLAESGEYLNTIRPVLRRQFMESPIMDYQGQARKFEAAIRQCWAEFCKK